MSRRTAISGLRLASCALLLVALLGVGLLVHAQTGSPLTSLATAYDLAWWTADGGGNAFSSAEGYSLGGTAGQPDANVLHGGEYTLAGGFWPGGETVREPREVYLPLVIRNY